MQANQSPHALEARLVELMFEAREIQRLRAEQQIALAEAIGTDEAWALADRAVYVYEALEAIAFDDFEVPAAAPEPQPATPLVYRLALVIATLAGLAAITL